MLKDIIGIRLCGANFEKTSDILLLDPHEGNGNKPKTVRGTLLYGRNGAGKSTLAIITAYYPDTKKFENDLKTRRKR